jgi:hypothetical protein
MCEDLGLILSSGKRKMRGREEGGDKRGVGERRERKKQYQHVPCYLCVDVIWEIYLLLKIKGQMNEVH